ncbi:hypothetical protein C0991_000361 [Blastosporella zonata]|nr:hypothetical protein C0991_000361 [Blastosporella zonata]
MGQPGDVIRPAGLLERYHISRFSLGLDSCVLMTAQYKAPEGQTLDRDTIYNALRRVIERHAVLGVRLARDPTLDPTFERLQKVDLSEIVEFSDETNLEGAIQAQLLRKFDFTSHLPLWRVVILADGTICFAFHHGIGDGKSGLAFHRALFASLQEGKGHGGDAIVTPSDGPLVPAIETLVDLSPSWRKIGVEIFRLFAPVSWTRDAASWTGNLVSTTITLQNHVRLINFTPAIVSDLLVLCRSKKTTITSLIHCLANSVISGLISDEQYKTLTSVIPISLRDLSRTSNNAICNHVSTFRAYPKVNPTFSWEDAAQTASDLRSHVKKSPEEIGMLKFLFGKYDAYFQGKLGRKRPAGLEVSNVGRFDVQIDSSNGQMWSIGRMAFAQCDVVVGAALKMNVVGDALGGITISLIWGANSVSDAFANAFAANFENGIGILMKETMPYTPVSGS